MERVKAWIGLIPLGQIDLSEVPKVIEGLPPFLGDDYGKLLRVEFEDGSYFLASRDLFPDHYEIHFSVRASQDDTSHANEFIKRYIADRKDREFNVYATNYLGRGYRIHYTIKEKEE